MTQTDDATKRTEVFSAMMDSLICSFQMADDTASHPIFSFNYGDVAEVLDFYRAITRADLDTQPDPLTDPRVKALVEAAKKMVSAFYSNGNVTERHLRACKAGVALDAALAAFDTTGGKDE